MERAGSYPFTDRAGLAGGGRPGARRYGWRWACPGIAWLASMVGAAAAPRAAGTPIATFLLSPCQASLPWTA